MDEVEVRFNSMARWIHFFPSLMVTIPLYVRDGQYEISYSLLLLSLLVKAASSYEALLHLFYPPIVTTGMSRFYTFFTIGNFEYTFCVSCFSFFKVFFTIKNMNTMFNLLRKSDVNLNRLGEPIDFSTIVILDGLILLMMSLPTTIRFYNVNSLTFSSGAEQIYLTWVNFTIYLSIAPFLQLAYILRKRFNLLQVNLLNSVASKRWDEIEQLIIIYTDYCQVCDMLNDSFSQQILLAFTVTFMSIVLGCYRSITAYILGVGAYVTVIKAFVSFQYVILAVFMTKICESTSSEAKEFNALLYQIMLDDKTNNVATNKKVQLHITMKREVQFTACGFFPLDYTLVHSMIAAATTYLVILIQFGQSSTSPNVLPNTSSFPNSTQPTMLLTTPM